MLAERAAFSYALLRTSSALYPRMVFRQRFQLTDDDFSAATVERICASIDGYAQQSTTASGQERAFLQLLVDDARVAVKYLEQHADELGAYEPERVIAEYTDVAEDYLSKRLGLGWHRQCSVVVEHYPPPFEDADWFAVAGASGMPTASVAGIHFLRRHMAPIVTALATLHENVHHGTRGPGGYHRYFDEGIANFLAYTMYYDRTRDLDGVRLFHTFLDELNVLYAYPPMLRVLAAMHQQVGLTGLLRLIRWRAETPDQVDWTDILRQTRAGALQIPAFPGTSDEAPLPSLDASAAKVCTVITFPEKALVSPVAFLVFESVCERGSVPLDEIRATWGLSQSALDGVVAELADHFVWNVTDGQLTLFGHSDFMRGTGILRARAL